MEIFIWGKGIPEYLIYIRDKHPLESPKLAYNERKQKKGIKTPLKQIKSKIKQNKKLCKKRK